MEWLFNGSFVCSQAVYTAVALFVFLVCSQLPLYGIKTNAGIINRLTAPVASASCHPLQLLDTSSLLSEQSHECRASVVQAATPSTGRA